MGINEAIDVITRLHDEDVAIAVVRTAEIVRCGMEYARKVERKNDNWDIVWAMPVGENTEIGIRSFSRSLHGIVSTWSPTHGDITARRSAERSIVRWRKSGKNCIWIKKGVRNYGEVCAENS